VNVRCALELLTPRTWRALLELRWLRLITLLRALVEESFCGRRQVAQIVGIRRQFLYVGPAVNDLIFLEERGNRMFGDGYIRRDATVNLMKAPLTQYYRGIARRPREGAFEEVVVNQSAPWRLEPLVKLP